LKKHFLVAKIVYMLGLAAICWAGKWEIVFVLGKKHISNTFELLFSACAFMRYWAGLYPEMTMIKAGVNMMVKTAFQMLKETRQAAPALMIRGMESETEDGVADLEKEAEGALQKWSYA
jgi:hypothetical protein